MPEIEVKVSYCTHHGTRARVFMDTQTTLTNTYTQQMRKWKLLNHIIDSYYDG